MGIYRHLYAIITIFISLTLLLPPSTPTPSPQQADCSRASYTRCVSLADPLLKDPALIFPDNMADIELVCLTWNSFVDCLKGYTDRCFTREQRRQFNKAVENPIESVHMMCTQQQYQQEYLQHASCIKSTVTEHDHCGDQYSQLVDQVSQGEAISRASLCCSHDRFRRCVMREAQRMCDRGVPNGSAVRFAEQIIDKALSFLQDQCYNYIPNSGDCLTVSYKSSDDQLAMSTSPWFTTRGRDTPSSSSLASSPHYRPVAPPLDDPLSTDVTVLDLGAGGGGVDGTNAGGVGADTPGDGKVTDQWMPTGGRDENKEGDTTSGTMLGSRTRPSSYGRSSSWDTSPGPTLSTWHVYNTGNTGNTGNTASSSGSSSGSQGTVGVAGSTNSGGGSTWSEGNTVGGGYNRGGSSPTTNQATNSLPGSPFFTNTQQSQQTTTETWYPAAGSHAGNAVDEPNQLGLQKPKNGGSVPKVIAVQLSFTVVATVLVAYC